MSASLVAVLSIAIMVVAISCAVSIYFVCQLVDRVAKLNAAGTPEEYMALRRIDSPPPKQDPPEDTNYTSDDGTLSEEAVKKIASQIEDA